MYSKTFKGPCICAKDAIYTDLLSCIKQAFSGYSQSCGKLLVMLLMLAKPA
jgi:hypothetical protein